MTKCVFLKFYRLLVRIKTSGLIPPTRFYFKLKKGFGAISVLVDGSGGGVDGGGGVGSLLVFDPC